MASNLETKTEPEPSSDDRQWPWGKVPNDKNDFISDLEQFHAQRGTSLDREPKVSNKHIDLWRLFETVERHGGYDKVSAEKLAWRKLAQEFGLHQPAYAFQVKTIFYKYLAAYAIKRIYSQEPPPREILEDLTARGGDLLTRTTENFEPPVRGQFQDAQADASLEDVQTTPKVDRMDVDDSAGIGRSGRSLRQAPAPRQIFVPDVSSSRQPRNTGLAAASAQSSPANVNGVSAVATSNRFDPSTYEGLTFTSQNLITAITPHTQPLTFHNRIKVAREQHRAAQDARTPLPKGMLIPGTGSSGAMGRNIYVRVLNSLRSPNDDDKRWAVHHLVKISEIQGHRFRFDAFSGMAEGLIEIALSVSSLFFDVVWSISYDDQIPTDLNILDGLRGTADILWRIGKLRRLEVSDDVHTKHFKSTLSICNEATLTIRNLSFLESNAWFLASMLPVKDMLCIILHLPKEPGLNEMKHHALEIAAQVVKYLPLTGSDPLYLGIMQFINEGHDRGALLTALCAVCRVASIARDASMLPRVSPSILRQLHSWLFLDDDELVQACLEYFYHYTVAGMNVADMLERSISLEFPMHAFVDQLARLLEHNAKEDVVGREIAPAVSIRAAKVRREIPEKLVKDLLRLKEPERASSWLRCMFEEDAKEDITQLELWQSYQGTFLEKITEGEAAPLMTAAEFIKNVSITLRGATAKIVNPPKGDPTPPRFIMSGIRYKQRPTGPEGQEYTKCLWRVGSNASCEKSIEPGKLLFDHILVDHLGLGGEKMLSSMSKEEAAKVKPTDNDCQWSSCRHFARCHDGRVPSAIELTQHICLHMSGSKGHIRNGLQRHHNGSIAPNDPNRAYKVKDRSMENKQNHPPIFDYNAFYDTITDERNHPCGIAYWAVMTLRNLARSVPKAVSGADKESALVKASQASPGDVAPNYAVWVRKLFLPVRRQIFYVLAYNRVLAELMFDLILLIEKGMDGKHEKI